MDKLQSLRLFLKLKETLSFKQTALHFDVPPSTVSRAIKSLEQELGVVLFERTTRQVRLTEAGGWYAAEVLEPLRALSAAETMVKAQSREPEGTLRLTALPGYGEIRLFSVLDRFRALYPRVLLDVELTDRYLDLSVGEIDIALRVTSDPPDYLVARPLHGHRYLMVASPDYLERRGRPGRVADIEHHAALGYRGPNGVTAWLARKQSGEVITVPRTLSLISNHGVQLLRAAQQGEGLALLPSWGVADGIADGSLVEVRVEDACFTKSAGPEVQMYLLYDPRKARLGKVRAMVDFLLSELSHE